jgi:hypothetical protein
MRTLTAPLGSRECDGILSVHFDPLERPVPRFCCGSALKVGLPDLGYCTTVEYLGRDAQARHSPTVPFTGLRLINENTVHLFSLESRPEISFADEARW